VHYRLVMYKGGDHMLTVTQKIEQGLFKRDLVEKRVASLEAKLADLKAVADLLEGFARDMFNDTEVAHVQADLKTGRFILKRMNELGVL